VVRSNATDGNVTVRQARKKFRQSVSEPLRKKRGENFRKGERIGRIRRKYCEKGGHPTFRIGIVRLTCSLIFFKSWRGKELELAAVLVISTEYRMEKVGDSHGKVGAGRW